MSRVVITGVGVVSPIGNTKEEFWNSLMEGKHGFTLEQWFPGQSEELNVKASVTRATREFQYSLFPR